MNEPTPDNSVKAPIAANEPIKGASNQLRRSSSNKMIGGVAGGLGTYFAIDPTIFRIAFILSVLFIHGLGLLAYLLLWLLLPLDQSEDKNGESQLRFNAEELGHTVRQGIGRLQNGRNNVWLGWLLMGIGICFLFMNFANVLAPFVFRMQVWPFLLVIAGLGLLLWRRS